MPEVAQAAAAPVAQEEPSEQPERSPPESDELRNRAPVTGTTPRAAATSDSAQNALKPNVGARPSSNAVSAPQRPSEAEFRAALGATPVLMYGTSWCGTCGKARSFLSSNGLRYQEIDADSTPGAWDKVEQLAGRRAVPVILVDGRVESVGLDSDRIMGAVARSVERRLGVSGLRFEPARTR